MIVPSSTTSGRREREDRHPPCPSPVTAWPTNRPCRWTVILACLLAATGGATSGCRDARPGPGRPRPDLVLVVVDALRRDHVGAYGYPEPTTPFIDSLAARGAVFENAYSQAPQTMLATAAILTSRLFPQFDRAASEPKPDEVGELFELRQLAPSNLTLAEVLGAADYSTLAVFTNPHHHSSSGFDQGFDRWRFVTPAPGRAYGRATEVGTAFRELLREADPGRPLFAYLHFMDTHNPYSPPEEWARRFVTAHGVDRYVNGRPPAGREPSDEDLRFMIQSYDAGLRYVDEELHGLVTALRAARGDRPSIVVVTADHGEEFMDHGGLGHGHSMEPELLRIPLVVSGADVDHGRPAVLTRGLDLAPTLLELAGVAAPSAFEGRSRVPELRPRGGTRSDRTAAGAGTVVATGAVDDGNGDVSFAMHDSMRSVTTPRCSLAFDRATGEATFREDGAEPVRTTDLEGLSSECLARARRLLGELGKRRRQSRIGKATAPVGREVEEQLRALGYLDGR